MANIRGTAANNNLVGTVSNDVIDGLGGADTMAGGLGNDVYVVDNVGDIVIESAGAGIDTVQANISYLLTANVENLQLTGTANINGTGNVLNNSLTGNSGNNILDGGAGVDTMAGGAGNDTYIVDNIGDVVTEANNQGTDNVQASVNHTLAANIENLALIGSALIGTGNTLNNTITGNSANNTLNGGAGVDTLIGGLGDDTYIVDNAGDVVTEAAGAGIDSVQASASYVLGANVENLTLTGIANINGTGNALDNIITGNNGNNTLSGGLGADTLNGGAGIDSLIGGAGNDTYIVDNAGDVINELIGEGTDTAQASASYTLGATNIENLTLTGTGNINGTGNALDNIITGNSGNNVLNGGAGNDTLNGGLGLDTMIGGTGNDTFVVDNAGDVVTEAVGAGTDTAQASVSYVIGANVENLVLTGTAAINGTGNATNNTITGNSGNNILDGAAGADTLIGGLGDDTYIVDNAGDVITEAAGEGTDTVQTSASYILGNELENLTLTGIANINGTGNALNNTLTGNSGSNILDGAAGIDTLIGGAGNDTYIVVDTDDVIIENIGGGIDTVQASIDYTLGETEIENLTLIGLATVGTGNTLNNTITGNALDNVLDGADGNDTLDGAGGSDILLGGFGDDTYIVNDTSALIIEGIEEGYDTVISNIDFALSADVENLTLVGIDAINGTGNELNNVIIGNSADNILNGGAGDDYLSGGAGNDTYIVDSFYDTVIENADEGLDTVESSVSYTLGANIEILTLTGESSINGTGNALGNIITGNDGDNIINGAQGGNLLLGGLGNDTYIHDEGVGRDTIVDTDGIGSIVYRSINGVEYLLTGGSGSELYGYRDVTGQFLYSVNEGVLVISTGDQEIIRLESYNPTSNNLGIVLTENVAPTIVIGESIQLVDTNANGMQANNTSSSQSISSDGRYIAFASNATNLVENQTAFSSDIFVKDLQTGNLTLVSSDANGIKGNAPSYYITAISGNGRYVAFYSDANNLVANDTNDIGDIFVKDLQTGVIVRANIDTNGAEMQKVTTVFNGNIYDGTQMQLSQSGISIDGRYLTFVTNANNLTEGDINNRNDIFVKDLQTGLIKNLTVNQPVAGVLLLGGQAISGDGQLVTYRAGTLNSHDLYVQNIVTGAIVVANTDSAGVNLSASVTGQISGVDISTDGNYVAFVQGPNVYVKNLTTGELNIASADINGVAGVFNAGNFTVSQSPSISADGRYVAFTTNANNLVVGDTNNLIDVYVKDMQTGNIARVNVNNRGEQANATAIDPNFYQFYSSNVVISDDGTKITYGSNAFNLVTDDFNNAPDVFVSPNPLLNVDTIIDAGSGVINNITIEDTDAGLNPFAINLQVENGDLKMLNTTGLIFTDSDGTDGTLSFSGLLGDVNKALTAGVQYSANVGFTGIDALLLSVNDQSIASLGDTATFAITVQNQIRATTITGDAITGTAFNDNLVGTGLTDLIRGLTGDDYINAGASDDFIEGGDGNDTLDGGLGLDVIHGGNGNDILTASAPIASYTASSYNTYLSSIKADSLYGGAGNDTYILSAGTITDSSLDYYYRSYIVEGVNAGIDTISADFNVSLGNYANIENVILQGNNSVSAHGNELDNTILGNDADNSLSGGAGINILTGGGGNDIFGLFNQGIDTITDFVSGLDRVDVTNLYYLPFDNTNGFGNGLAASGFVSGVGVTSGDGSAQLIYNTTDGNLYYEDGLNADAAVQIATLIGVPDINLTDINYIMLG